MIIIKELVIFISNSSISFELMFQIDERWILMDDQSTIRNSVYNPLVLKIPISSEIPGYSGLWCSGSHMARKHETVQHEKLFFTRFLDAFFQLLFCTGCWRDRARVCIIEYVVSKSVSFGTICVVVDGSTNQSNNPQKEQIRND